MHSKSTMIRKPEFWDGSGCQCAIWMVKIGAEHIIDHSPFNILTNGKLGLVLNLFIFGPHHLGAGFAIGSAMV